MRCDPSSDPGRDWGSGAARAPARGRNGLCFLLRGAAQTVATVAGFVAFGLAWAVVEEAGARGAEAYPWEVELIEHNDRGGDDTIWLVDGFNVLHAVVLGGRERAAWWTRPYRAELLARAAGFDDPSAQIWVVFDGARAAPQSAAGPGVHEVFAASADEWLLARLQGAAHPERIAVVTADRKLAGRAQHRGARVVSPRAFLARCS